jgi:sec-independent protein translocase protein TatB
MFDIGFWELMFIVLIALVVVGPERLPKLAYTAGKWVGKARGMLTSVKTEIDKEMKAEELKRILEEQQKSLDPLQNAVEETREAVDDLNKYAHQSVDQASQGPSPSSPTSPASSESPKA